jgi:lipoate-protein ligase A
MTDATRHHGEFKTPGGKLVQVDFSVESDRLVDVLVSGDFFLYPEEALEGITAVLERSPRDLSLADRSALIASAITDDVEWLGSSPEGLAMAIDRALQTNG